MVNKIISVIKSCNTLEQLIASKRFLFLYLKTLKSVREKDDVYNDVIVFYNKQNKLIRNG